MNENEDSTPFSLMTLLGLKPFTIKASIIIYLFLCIGWITGFGFAKSTDLFAMRAKTQEEITSERWQKSNDPNQLGKVQTPPPSNQPMGINELFRPQPSGINPFDATRHQQASAPVMIADWPVRIETIAMMSSMPLIGLIVLLIFIRQMRRLERAEAEAAAAEKTRLEEEKHRARRRGKGIPMQRLR
jgi:uncharacterized membrane protein